MHTSPGGVVRRTATLRQHVQHTHVAKLRGLLSRIDAHAETPVPWPVAEDMYAFALDVLMVRPSIHVYLHLYGTVSQRQLMAERAKERVDLVDSHGRWKANCLPNAMLFVYDHKGPWDRCMLDVHRAFEGAKLTPLCVLCWGHAGERVRCAGKRAGGPHQRATHRTRELRHGGEGDRQDRTHAVESVVLVRLYGRSLIQGAEG
jgi:hypothetical protein